MRLSGQAYLIAHGDVGWLSSTQATASMITCRGRPSEGRKASSSMIVDGGRRFNELSLESRCHPIEASAAPGRAHRPVSIPVVILVGVEVVKASEQQLRDGGCGLPCHGLS